MNDRPNDKRMLRRAALVAFAFGALSLIVYWVSLSNELNELKETEAEGKPVVSDLKVRSRFTPSPAVPRPSLVLPSAAEAPSQADAESAVPPPQGIELFDNSAKPFRIGVVVPDDFVLPPGYVRHYQINEDGTPLKPILMYHPDFQPKDETGAAVLVPSDLIVPNDQLPKGLEPVMLEVPRVYFDGGVL